MTDIYSKNKRSDIMSKISGKETKPEILVRRYLFSKGFRYRKNVIQLPGKPDVVLPKYKTIIFIHGCFWHGHTNCKAAKLPQTNIKFWREKIGRNIDRDSQNTEKLLKEGWKVLTVWQCEVKAREKASKRLEQLVREIKE